MVMRTRSIHNFVATCSLFLLVNMPFQCMQAASLSTDEMQHLAKLSHQGVENKLGFKAHTLKKSKHDFRYVLDLSGSWNCTLDSLNQGIQEAYWTKQFAHTVILPGTTDTNHIGNKNTNKSETTHLSRYYTYQGAAWYSKEVVIPNDLKDKHIILFLERTRPTQVWVDAQFIGSNNNLSTPHRYDLSAVLTPGTHRITIRVDNGTSIPMQIRSNSHACAESTQTNWNGIIGRIELQGMNPLHIQSINTYSDIEAKCVHVKVTLSQSKNLEGKKIVLKASTFNTNYKHQVKAKTCVLENDQREYDFCYSLGKHVQLWSDVSPALYRLNVELVGVDKQEVIFAMRDFQAKGTQFYINGKKTFLRGKHDACVFPLTGYPPMDINGWRRYFRICKEYGLNHCRFHSWCPPEACFAAADLEGIYLQPELPIWGEFSEKAKELMNFLMKDGEGIQSEYSNHPSFTLFSLGNELNGKIEVMKRFVHRYREMENRHLYTYGSNIYLGGAGHIPSEDFLVACRVGWGDKYTTHVRASFSFADADQGGYLNNTYPNTQMNFDKALLKSSVPVIGHETGQYQIYPNYNEISKYTGVLAPWNFEVFRAHLEQKGMGQQADDFFKASGAWAVELYKADIEMNLRSTHMAGFQLLDLQDYPGQGSAYVGVLDAFMDSKGLVTPRKWRNFCSEVVPLLLMKKYCWTENEEFNAILKIANYAEKSLEGKKLLWMLKNGHTVLSKGKATIPSGMGVLNLDTIRTVLPTMKDAYKATLSLYISGTDYQNTYPIWVYPKRGTIQSKDIKIVHQLSDNVIASLQHGEKVLLMPNQKDCKGVTVGGLFQTDYWNYRMFKSICDYLKKPVSPGTLGLLTDSKHPVFNHFPTENHTNWQWYSIVKNSYPLILDHLPQNYRPIVQVIDNVERNHKLGLLLELSVGKGKLLICMADLSNQNDVPEVSQFYNSLLLYMDSPEFHPTTSISPSDLLQLFTPVSGADAIKELKNISYD